MTQATPDQQSLSSASEPDIREKRGLLATVNLTGLVEAATSECILQSALWNSEHGLTQIEYRTFAAQLVEAGRDAVCSHALQEKYDWLLMVDGDATFQADAVGKLLHTAYVTHPSSDVVGAYCQLKGSYLPTIDCGSGRWEPHWPGEGVLPVIRTGGHFLLVKTDILRRFGPPWFRTRQTLRPIRILAELDNFARCNLAGENPFRSLPEWETLTKLAREKSSEGSSSVGEDSGFCDAVRAAGGSILVDTGILTGHIDRKVIGPADLKDTLRKHEEKIRLAVGVLE